MSLWKKSTISPNIQMFKQVHISIMIGSMGPLFDFAYQK